MKLQEINDLFKADDHLLEASLYEFQIPSDEIDRQYGLNQENAWSSPDIRPSHWDKNWETWFRRISTWGKINILHVDPEHKVREFVSQNKFIDSMSTADMLKVYGKWNVEQVKINKMEFQRVYIGINGKEYKEIFQIKVDLLPALSRGLGFWQKFS